MFDTEKFAFDSIVSIKNERFTELLHKEERLSIIERMVAHSEYITVKDIKVVLGVEERESGENE